MLPLAAAMLATAAALPAASLRGPQLHMPTQYVGPWTYGATAKASLLHKLSFCLLGQELFTLSGALYVVRSSLRCQELFTLSGALYIARSSLLEVPTTLLAFSLLKPRAQGDSVTTLLL